MYLCIRCDRVCSSSNGICKECDRGINRNHVQPRGVRSHVVFFSRDRVDDYLRSRGLPPLQPVQE